MPAILTVMNDMADAMTAVNASRRQIRGVAAWRELVAAAVEAGEAAGAGRAGLLTAPVTGSQTHAQWMATADAIIATLADHNAEAEAMTADARELADDGHETRRRADADRAQAEAHELHQQAAACARRAAAAARDAEEFEERAEACEAWAAACRDASAYGASLAAREDDIHAPVSHAIAAAGGRGWIADDKHFLAGGA